MQFILKKGKNLKLVDQSNVKEELSEAIKSNLSSKYLDGADNFDVVVSDFETLEVTGDDNQQYDKISKIGYQFEGLTPEQEEVMAKHGFSDSNVLMANLNVIITPLNSGLHVVMYSTPNCMKCRITKQNFAKSIKNDEGIDVSLNVQDYYKDNIDETNVIDILSEDENKKNWSLSKVEKIKEKYGVKSMPLVKIVDNDGHTIDFWSDMDVAAIKKWKEVTKNAKN